MTIKQILIEKSYLIYTSFILQDTLFVLALYFHNDIPLEVLILGFGIVAICFIFLFTMIVEEWVQKEISYVKFISYGSIGKQMHFDWRIWMILFSFPFLHIFSIPFFAKMIKEIQRRKNPGLPQSSKSNNNVKISDEEYIKRLTIGSIIILLTLAVAILLESINYIAILVTVIAGMIFNFYLRNTYIQKIRQGDPNFLTFKEAMKVSQDALWVESSFRIPVLPLFFLPLIKSTLDEAEKLKKQREQKEAKESY